MNKELFAKAKEANSAEELPALAKDNDIEMTEEQAQEHFERPNGELSDDELSSIAGGAGKDGRYTIAIDGEMRSVRNVKGSGKCSNGVFRENHGSFCINCKYYTQYERKPFFYCGLDVI